MTNAWKRSERISTSPAVTGLISPRLAERRRRRTTLCTRAMTSSGWQGLVIQSSAPRRSPRTRWATVEGPVQTTMPSSGSAPQRRSSHVHACGPRIARSTTSAERRIETTTSAGTGLPSTRCSQPSRSRRLLNTWMKPLSRSRTAMRRGEAVEDAPRASGAACSRSSRRKCMQGTRGNVCGDDRSHSLFTERLANSGGEEGRRPPRGRPARAAWLGRRGPCRTRIRPRRRRWRRPRPSGARSRRTRGRAP